MHNRTDWAIFIALFFSFNTLIAICLYQIWKADLLKQLNTLLRFDLENAYKTIDKQRDYIETRDKQGWNYVYGSGSGELEVVLQEDNRGRHQRLESVPESSQNTEVIFRN